MDMPEYDVIVVGAGNAATCAALVGQGKRRVGVAAGDFARSIGAAAIRPLPAAPGASSITGSTIWRG